MKRYGWFEYKQEPIRIANYLTGQELVVTSVTEQDHITSYCGLYKDSEIEQPLKFFIHHGFKKIKGIRLDYRDFIPNSLPYGYWRRVDDFLIDALLCWPSSLGQSGWFWLDTFGGWRNGVWNPEFHRQFSSRKASAPDKLSNYQIAEPYIIPVETPHLQPGNSLILIRLQPRQV